METMADYIFLGSKITVDSDCSHEIKRCLLLRKKAMTNLDSILKSRDITLPTKVCPVKAMVFSSSHVWMCELDHKESWAPKDWCFWIVVMEKTLESSLDCKEIQPVNPKGNQSWIFIGRTGAEAEILTFWPPDVKNWLIGKDPDVGKDWRQEKGTTEDEIVGCHYQLDGHEFEQAPGFGDGQGLLQSTGLQRVGHNWATKLNWLAILFQTWWSEKSAVNTLPMGFLPFFPRDMVTICCITHPQHLPQSGIYSSGSYTICTCINLASPRI